MNRKKTAWRMCIFIALLIILFTYTPLVIKPGKYLPSFLHLPYTLWLSILLTIGMVLLTYIGSKVMPDDEEDVQ